MPAPPTPAARLARDALARGGWSVLSHNGYRVCFALLALRLEPGAPRFVVVPEDRMTAWGLKPLTLGPALAEARAAGLVEIEPSAPAEATPRTRRPTAGLLTVTAG